MFTTARNGLVALVAAMATGAALLCGPAQAESTVGEIPTVAVHYADLDLTSDAGIRALYRRLQFAAKEVCRDFEGREIAKMIRHRACYKESLSAAVAKVNVELLSVLHRNASASTRPRVS